MQSGQHQSRNVCARDVRHSEPFLRGIGVKEAHREAEYGDTARVGVAFGNALDRKPYDEADGDRRGEEGDHHADRTSDVARAARGVYADEEGEQDYAYDVVDDGGGDDGHAHFGVEFAEFLERGDGDGHGSRRKYRAVEQAGDEVGLREGGEAAVQHAACREEAEQQGERDAEQSDDHAGDAYLFELLEVGVEPGGEHDEYDAYLCEEGQPFHRGRGEHALSGNVADAAEQNAGDDHADDLRQSEFLAEDGKELCDDEYQRKRQKQFVHVHDISPCAAA